MKRVLVLIMLLVLVILSVTNAFAIETGYVNCDVLNVRVSPNTSCEIIDKMPNGTSFNIIYTDNGWYNIKMQNGVTGFVSADYVTKIDDSVASATTASEDAKKIASLAHNYIGCRYSYGSTGPSSFDCSGFTTFLYKQYGYALPRTSTSQGQYGTYVDKSNLAEGDIVCFSNRSDRRINHVGVYVGNGNFIHASTSGRGVVMDSLYEDYYVRNYICARRVL